MNEDVYELYRKTFPYISRNQNTVKRIINNESNKVFRKELDGVLAGCAIVNRNTILLLAVDEDFRKNGIGSGLLKQCEEEIKNNCFNRIILGVGFDYLMPGVPTSRKYAESVHENLNSLVNSSASDFFEKRGYVHSWKECNCFDMRMSLNNLPEINEFVGDTINGVNYKWALHEDLPGVIACADDACKNWDESFSVYYKNTELYEGNEKKRVLIAKRNESVVGALIVSAEDEEEHCGNVGCTSVVQKEWHNGIATKLVQLGTKYLKELGLSNASLSYTYSGLDKLYGTAGYKITVYYFMGEKGI